jgi:hypothetical protein
VLPAALTRRKVIGNSFFSQKSKLLLPTGLPPVLLPTKVTSA